MKYPLISAILFLSIAMPGCATEDGTKLGGESQDKADQISGRDDPSGILGNAERRLSSLIDFSERGKSYGVDPAVIPYPDTFWPMTENGIAAEWAEERGGNCPAINHCVQAQPSPLEKLVDLYGGNVQAAVDWERKHHGQGHTDPQGNSDLEAWLGHCPGWVAGAMLNKPILHPVYAKSNGAGGIQACQPQDPQCTKFEIGDINALSAEAYDKGPENFIGGRCDTAPDQIKRDQLGRIIRTGSGCQGLNAGSMLILMANRLKIQKKPFAIDVQSADTTNEIWNQPAFAYKVNRYDHLSEREAANLVASGRREGTQTRYQWNNRARGFAFVDFSLLWVTETSEPNLDVVRGIDSYETTRMIAVIELDAPAGNPAARIIGGEYIDDPSVEANRLSVAPFAWVSRGMSSESAHNPYVKNRLVQQLINMGNNTAR